MPAVSDVPAPFGQSAIHDFQEIRPVALHKTLELLCELPETRMFSGQPRILAE